MSKKLGEGRIRMNKLENYILQQARYAAKKWGVSDQGLREAVHRIHGRLYNNYTDGRAPKSGDDDKFLEQTP